MKLAMQVMNNSACSIQLRKDGKIKKTKDLLYCKHCYHTDTGLRLANKSRKKMDKNNLSKSKVIVKVTTKTRDNKESHIKDKKDELLYHESLITL